ncbi:cyanamide hydratase [Sphaerisporangium melleum]|uniref:Cyanamide hydratase n=1 Tax=Sphaerisporangium melleum TaxID=321316 RepID=A0A917RFH4_9ACTN|nr:HD domain-containing protein [Sphaerisporangium melleum]GGL05514.1 cyanamide hydratase [Sphaerisporangium melleum]GII73879.1 cyanamide hydratase [Sphaerisporangium melleum]
MRLDEIPVPGTPAAGAAREVAAAYCSPALLNHSVRSYLWGASYGTLNGIAYDAELLYVSALLHDIGLVKEFDSHTVPFEDAGGHVAWVLGAGAGWPAERRTRALEVIVRHMWDEVDPAQDPEGHLLEVATSLDISGRRPDAWPAELRAEVIARYPRLDLAAEFTACFEDQAARKPDTTAARAVRSGIAGRLAANPLEAHDPV